MLPRWGSLARWLAMGGGGGAPRFGSIRPADEEDGARAACCNPIRAVSARSARAGACTERGCSDDPATVGGKAPIAVAVTCSPTFARRRRGTRRRDELPRFTSLLAPLAGPEHLHCCTARAPHHRPTPFTGPRSAPTPPRPHRSRPLVILAVAIAPLCRPRRALDALEHTLWTPWHLLRCVCPSLVSTLVS